MKEGKKVEIREIVVLDKGIDKEKIHASRMCCWGPLFAFRG